MNRRKRREKKRKLLKNGTLSTGYVELTAKGHAYIKSTDLTEDVFIHKKNTKHVLNGDKVEIMYTRNNKNKLEGEILDILEMGNRNFIGVLEITNDGYGFVVCDSRNMPHDIHITERKILKSNAKDGQKVYVNVTEWNNGKNPIGEIINVLGWSGDNETEINSIMSEFELPIDFSSEVLEFTNNIPNTISEEEIKKRRDFRNITTFTIDPDNAKDFDDALSIKKIGDDYEIGVHIADVSHYVCEDSFLDKEAMNRATSVYLVDRVIPMLPERISNEICSLRPNEDKLCFSVVFIINDKAEIKKEWIGKTIINSDKRFTYDDAQFVIDGGNQFFEMDFENEILILDRIAKQLREKRFNKKSISFNRIEPKFKLDENGKPLDVYFNESKDANKLIEEFMLLANRKVAERIGKVEKNQKAKTFIYRNHDLPNQEKLENLSNFVKNFDYELEVDEDNVAQSLNKLMNDIHGKPEEKIIESHAVRTMSKAVYSTVNIGHYGLGFKHYSHFTSPIRRFPDVMVHRLLNKYLNNEQSENQEKYEGMCIISSEQEKRAAKAERESIKYKQVEFMGDKIGNHYNGVITSITDWGIYVELHDFMIEGMIRISDMKGEFIFDSEQYRLVGENDKYQIGDNVVINVESAILQNKELNFSLKSNNNNEEF